MNCRNCGAPMELFDRRRYYFCHHCGTFHFLETTEKDGVEVIGRPAEPLGCPVCRAPMAKALLDRSHQVEYCEQCRGVLLSRATFVEVITRRRSSAQDSAVAPAPLNEHELQRRVVCPSCRTGMNVHPYFGPGNIVIDTCDRCDVIWLDFGELKQVIDAPGRDRGMRRMPDVERSIAREPPQEPDPGDLLAAMAAFFS
jgi:Zn-finger nucleic acid-binding protein